MKQFDPIDALPEARQLPVMDTPQAVSPAFALIPEPSIPPLADKLPPNAALPTALRLDEIRQLPALETEELTTESDPETRDPKTPEPIAETEPKKEIDSPPTETHDPKDEKLETLRD